MKHKPAKSSLENQIYTFFIKKVDEPFTVEQLVKVLKIKSKKKLKKIFSFVQECENRNIIQQDGAYYQNYFQKKSHETTFLFDSNGGGKVKIDEKEYLMAPELCKNANHNDTVTCDLFFMEKISKTPHLKITEIRHRTKQEYLGDISESSRGIKYITSRSLNFKTDIRNHQKVKAGEKVKFRVLGRKKGERFASGEIIEILGKSGEQPVEDAAILLNYQIRNTFSAECLKEAENLKKTNQFNPEGRKDFRDIFTITIDPEDAKDFDDAISFAKTPRGYNIGVHIADVSHFVEEGNELDKEALRRGNSVYLTDRTVPMLPEVLSNDLCSLKPNEDRYAFSVDFSVGKNFQIQSFEIHKSIIHSNRRFSYEEVQKIIENQKGAYQDEILLLYDFTKFLRSERFKKGAISFTGVDVKVKLNEKKEAISIKKTSQNQAQKMIEELMLLANRTIAKEIHRQKQNALYRVHERPDQKKIDELKDFLHVLGFNLNTSSDNQFVTSLNHILGEVRGQEIEDLVNHSAIRAMNKALYRPSNDGHFGLGFSFYTHFTSPIRRYTDLVIHRVLYQMMDKKGKMPIDFSTICHQCNQAEINATMAERDSQSFYILKMLERKEGQKLSGIIKKITDYCFFVEIHNFCIEGMLKFRDVKGEYLVYNPKKLRAESVNSHLKLSLGDAIDFQIKHLDYSKLRVDIKMN